jgi:ATP adenylyltransferase
MSHDNLWAPWRMQYIRQLDPQGNEGDSNHKACFLCDAAKAQPGTDHARQLLVLVRDERGIILLNRYPYTSGHLLVAVDRHVPDLTDLTKTEQAGLMELTTLGQKLLRTTANPQGLNIGMNLGRCAGAGLPGHLHLHIVPRWNGDTNFMQAVGQVRVIPEALETSFDHLNTALGKLAAR